MSTWNYRIVQFVDKTDPENIFFEVAEVYYNDNGDPVGYAKSSIFGESKDELATVMTRMQEALDKPVLWAERDFTARFNEEQDEHQHSRT